MDCRVAVSGTEPAERTIGSVALTAKLRIIFEEFNVVATAGGCPVPSVRCGETRRSDTRHGVAVRHRQYPHCCAAARRVVLGGELPHLEVGGLRDLLRRGDVAQHPMDEAEDPC